MIKQQIEDYWISVIDRLPEKDGLYLCMIRRETKNPDNQSIDVEYYHQLTLFRNNQFLLSSSEDNSVQFVIDWMNLPLPNKLNDKISYFEYYSFASGIATT
jgi:hypothetical protein